MFGIDTQGEAQGSQLATLRLPLRIYPEQPIDLPTFEAPLFRTEPEDDPNQVEWQETEAGWIEIASPAENDLRSIEQEADATELALRSLTPGSRRACCPE